VTALTTLTRLSRRRAEELQVELAALEEIVRDFDRRIVEHDRRLQAEKAEALGDPFSVFGNYARAAMQRREKLVAARVKANEAAEAHRAILTAAFVEMKKMETLAENEAIRVADEEAKRDQAMLDDAAGAAFARRG
jgi:flagellar export protein FliJ